MKNINIDRRNEKNPLASTHSIKFANSMCIIYKNSAENNTLVKRIIVGKTATVTQAIMELYGEIYHKANQSGNEWAARTLPLHEELAKTLAQIRDVRSELGSIKLRTIETENHNSDLGQQRLEAVESERDKIRKELSETDVAKPTVKKSTRRNQAMLREGTILLQTMQMSTS